MSPPRRLSSQAIELAAVSSECVGTLARDLGRDPLALGGVALAGVGASWRRTGAIGGGGRSGQIASIGFGSSATRLPPLALTTVSSLSRSARRASQGS